MSAVDATGNEYVASGKTPIYNITAAAVVKATPGRLVRINVVVAGSAAGTANDCATTGAAAAANEIAVIPNTVGTYYLDWPCATGIVVVPGTGQTVAVSYI
ncbi:hypothetical protein WM24_23835 [Burkholderia ubonensis]|nr:hypothetical protein WM24_23835 [Burkholderia ubonensis]